LMAMRGFFMRVERETREGKERGIFNREWTPMDANVGGGMKEGELPYENGADMTSGPTS
jgi:hypothetical protein